MEHFFFAGSRRNIRAKSLAQGGASPKRFGEVDQKSGSDSNLAGELAGHWAVRGTAARALALGGVLADTARHVESAQ